MKEVTFKYTKEGEEPTERRVLTLDVQPDFLVGFDTGKLTEDEVAEIKAAYFAFQRATKPFMRVFRRFNESKMSDKEFKKLEE